MACIDAKSDEKAGVINSAIMRAGSDDNVMFTESVNVHEVSKFVTVTS